MSAPTTSIEGDNTGRDVFSGNIHLGADVTPTPALGGDAGLDSLTQTIWEDLHGSVSIAEVRSVADALLSRYRDARIDVFIPIIVRRQAREILQESLRPVSEARLASFR